MEECLNELLVDGFKSRKRPGLRPIYRIGGLSCSNHS